MRALRTLLPLVLVGAGLHADSAPATGVAAASRSLVYLTEEADWWIDQKECMSCHHTGLALWAGQLALEAGLKLPGGKPTVDGWRSFLLEQQGSGVDKPKPNRPDEVSAQRNVEGISQLLLGPELVSEEDRKQIRKWIAGEERKDGTWKPNGQLPSQKRPAAETVAVSTMWARLALGRKEPVEAMAAKSTEWHVLRAWQRGDDETVDALLARQNDDGGWSWIEGEEESDPMATGQALLVLARLGREKDDAARKQAVQFLAGSQQEKGSWQIRSTKDRSEHTRVSNFWGSAWAVVGLLEDHRARQAGEAPAPSAKEGRTLIPAAVLARLDARKDVTYARYGERTLEMDIYRPKADWGTLPAVVCIHGGGWHKGNRSSHEKLAQAIAAKGYVAATISYRLSGEAPFPAQIHDCKAAVRFLRANAKQYGLDPDKIGAIGLSAGGHLTALLATSAGVEELEGDGGHAGVSSAIQAAIPMGAQTDLMNERTREISAIEERGKIWRQFLGGTQEEKPDTYRLASPLHHLDKTDPPVWLITGETDDPSTRAETFRARMRKLEIGTGLTVVREAPHAFIGRQAWFDQMMENVEVFLGDMLGPRK